MGITFFLNTYQDSEGYRRIMFRYSYGTNQKKYIFSTGMKVLMSSWSKKKRRVIVSAKAPYATKMNNTLDSIENEAKSIVDHIIYVDKKEPIYTVFKNSWEARNKDSNFFHCIDLYIKAKTNERLSDGAISNIRFLKNRLREMDKKEKISFSKMDQSFLDSFIQHCISNGYALYTIDTYISNLTSFLNYSHAREWHSGDKFKKWKRPKMITKREKPKKDLSMEELLRIEWIDLTGMHEKVRDIFVFMCFSGLRIGEYNLISRESRKGMVLEYEKKKQDTYSINKIALNSEMVRFIEKYETFPSINLKSFNEYLVEIAKLAGIEKRISSSWARHTFVNLSSQLGVSMNEISKTAGHSNTSVTEGHYNKSIPITLGAEQLSERIKGKREAFIRKLG